MDSELNKIKYKVKQELADYLGVDLEDIEDESTLTGDLHMTPVDLTDFIESLKSSFDTSKVDLVEMETFGDLTESLAILQ